MIAAVAPLLDPETEVIGNFHRIVAGETLTGRQIADGWKRIIKICAAAAQSLRPAVVELPPARSWSPREITILNVSGQPFVLRLSGTDAIHGAEPGPIQQPVLRLVPIYSDHADEGDGWIVK
jgi:hypothetical protein